MHLLQTLIIVFIGVIFCSVCESCTHKLKTGGNVINRFDSGRVAVEGGTLYYEIRGKGQPMVLLHAGATDLTMWDPQLPLANTFQVVRFDARGHGRSTAPMGRYSTVDDLKILLDHLNIKKASLVGISMGAGVALNFTIAYPERVQKLVLVSTSGPPPGVVLPPGTPPTLVEEAGRARLRIISIPRMLIVGEKDTPDHLSVAEGVEREVPEVKVVRIKGGGHLVNRDAAGQFNEILSRFLKN